VFVIDDSHHHFPLFDGVFLAPHELNGAFGVLHVGREKKIRRFFRPIFSAFSKAKFSHPLRGFFEAVLGEKSA
jgi:hypothetical protein